MASPIAETSDNSCPTNAVTGSETGSALRGVIGVAAGSLNNDPLKDDYTYRAKVALGADTSGLLNPTLNNTLGGYSSTVTTATAGSAFVQVGLYGTVKSLTMLMPMQACRVKPELGRHCTVEVQGCAWRFDISAPCSTIPRKNIRSRMIFFALAHSGKLFN